MDNDQTQEALLAVVVRHTDYPEATPDQRVELICWYLDVAQADREVARLNSVRTSDRVVYFVKLVRDRRDQGLPN